MNWKRRTFFYLVQKMQEMELQLEELNEENESLYAVIERLQEILRAKDDENRDLKRQLNEMSVRATYYECRRRNLYLFARTDGKLAFSACQNITMLRNNPAFDHFLYQWTFPASMNIRKQLKIDEVTTGIENIVDGADNKQSLIRYMRRYRPISEMDLEGL